MEPYYVMSFVLFARCTTMSLVASFAMSTIKGTTTKGMGTAAMNTIKAIHNN